jgi:thiol-disulfide isomerase/thioredoxin
LQQAMPPSGFLDEAVRKVNAERAVPLLHKMVALLGELSGTQQDPEAKADINAQQYEFYTYLVVYGDKETTAFLQKDAAGSDDKAIRAKSALALGSWWQNSREPSTQLKLLNDYASVAKANPNNMDVVQTLGTMMQIGAGNDEVYKKVLEVIKTNLTGDSAKGLLAQVQGAEAIRALVGRPLTVAGRTIDGGKFSSNDLKGKVVLVDFWATWCGPCVAALPRTQKLYDDYHAKGLEIVGVDADGADDVVSGFIKQKKMPWVQLREASQTGEDNWNPLAKQWHVDQIPTMFLIDKKGVLRYVDALDGTEEKVAALLAENDAATQPVAK